MQSIFCIGIFEGSFYKIRRKNVNLYLKVYFAEGVLQFGLCRLGNGLYIICPPAHTCGKVRILCIKYLSVFILNQRTRILP